MAKMQYFALVIAVLVAVTVTVNCQLSPVDTKPIRHSKYDGPSCNHHKAAENNATPEITRASSASGAGAASPQAIRKLFKRQISSLQQPSQPLGGAGGDQAGGFLSGINQLAQQAQQMAQAQQLLQSAQSLFSPKQQTPVDATVRSAMETAQSTSGAAMNGASQTSQSAQTGVRSALTELSSGLQRITQNNPNLLPDVRQLYQRVTSSMGGSAAAAPNPFGGNSNNPSNIVPANSQEELADNLAKVAIPGLQVGQQPQAAPQSGLYPNLFQSAIPGLFQG